MESETEVLQLLGKTDIAQRWGVSKQRLTYWEKHHEGFPKPAANVHNGKTPLYRLSDVQQYEETNKYIKYRKEETENGY